LALILAGLVSNEYFDQSNENPFQIINQHIAFTFFYLSTVSFLIDQQQLPSLSLILGSEQLMMEVDFFV